MSGRRLRCVLRRWRLLFLLWFVFFWLRTVRDTHEPKTANQSNKYFHKFFSFGVVRPFSASIYSTVQRWFLDAFPATKTRWLLRSNAPVLSAVGARPRTTQLQPL